VTLGRLGFVLSGREMDDRLVARKRSMQAWRVVECGFDDRESGAREQVAAKFFRGVVDGAGHRDLVAGTARELRELRADETGAAGEEDFHDRTSCGSGGLAERRGGRRRERVQG
jgi:hypothetical protein